MLLTPCASYAADIIRMLLLPPMREVRGRKISGGKKGVSDRHQIATAHIRRRGGFNMLRGFLTLTLSLCLGAVATPAALAQAAPAITEQEAHAIAVDAYVYFYSIVSMDVS